MMWTATTTRAVPAARPRGRRASRPRSTSRASARRSDTSTPAADDDGSRPSTDRRVFVLSAIAAALDAAIADDACRAIVFTGGTGVAPRDVTPDTIEPLLERVVPGFGELFRKLSYEDIGSAAILSRALAGLKAGKVVFVIPGSRGAVRLAMEKLIVPELGHLAGEAVKTR